MYTDHVAGCTYLPWVRLHALKGYYDLPSLCRSFPHIRFTFNLTPSLLTQLDAYASDPLATDEFLKVSQKMSTELTPQDKHFILSNFFMNNWQTVIKAHPHYNELLRKRGYEYQGQDPSTVIDRFSDQDFLDLQVLFNLCWFGFTYRREESAISALIQKQKNYSETDKKTVIHHQFALIKKIIPLFKELQDSSQIEISTSPAYHPIMPLLYSGPDEYGFDWSSDLDDQLDCMCVSYESFFGRTPAGVWPPEGAVSARIIPFLAKRGIEWIATDEDILFHSLGHAHRQQTLYRPYRVASGGHKITMIFRDRKLSDLIGFSYANSDPEHATADFMDHLRSVQHAVSGLPGDHVVPIILDGENAWEFYRDGGERFLSLLCEAISAEASFETVCMSDYLSRHPVTDELHMLHTGSWINHDLSIWSAHAEDQAAWHCVDEARKALLDNTAAPEVYEKARTELLIAEGSDWFWWYGDQFSSASDDVFDCMFRKHISNVYGLLSVPVPACLNEPIKNSGRLKTDKEPVALIHPVIDGRLTHYFEWENAGVLSKDGVFGTMCVSAYIIDTIFFGFDLDSLFFRLDLSGAAEPDLLRECAGYFELQTRQARFRLRFTFEKEPCFELFRLCDPAPPEHIESFSGVIAYDKIVELACRFSDLGTAPHDEIFFSFYICRDDVVLEKWPHFSGIRLNVPHADFEDSMWSA